MLRASVVCIASVVGLKITRSPARVVVAFIVRGDETIELTIERRLLTINTRTMKWLLRLLPNLYIHYQLSVSA